ncbi:MAG: multicopper oxidase family protein [Planctomycetota bacterium]
MTVAALTAQLPQTPLDCTTIPKYVDPLPHFAGARVDGTQPLTITMSEFQQDVLPASMYAGLPSPYDRGTWVWGYGVETFDRTAQIAPPLYPGYTIEARRGRPTRIRYVNQLVDPVLQQYLIVDQTLHWANPLGLHHMDPLRLMPFVGPTPVVPHLHGGETPSFFDGGPDQWFTAGGLRGPSYHSMAGAGPGEAIYEYPNDQEPTTLWFHDHTLGATRLNVYAGLAAFYFLRDDCDCGHHYGDDGDDDDDDDYGWRWRRSLNLPDGDQEIEIVIQDRLFDTNGQWYFPTPDAMTGGMGGHGPTEAHPFWIPEFLGDAIVVNGKTWPYLEVQPRRYRFRFLNGSNARFYSMDLVDVATGAPGPVFWQIGSDGGLLDRPVKIDPNDARDPRKLLMAPGERVDLIVDFSGFAGSTLRLTNDANAPFPDGDPVTPGLNDQVMEFRVSLPMRGRDRSFDPSMRRSVLRLPMTSLWWDAIRGGIDARRLLTLNEVLLDTGPLEALVNNSKWGGLQGGPDGSPIPGAVQDQAGNWVTEVPRVGATEVWQLVNLTGDAHPIHVHLVQFQVVGRQPFDPAYEAVYNAAFPTGDYVPAGGPPLDYRTGNPQALGGNPEIRPYLLGTPRAAEPGESGWKDTVIAYPGEVTTFLVRFAPQDVGAGRARAGRNEYPFDPTQGPGYVWHCHIIDHEDNEMMRPMLVGR